MMRIDRRKALKMGVTAAAGAGGLLLGTRRADAALWVARDNFLSVLRNAGNWAYFNPAANYLLWESGGRKLDELLRAFNGTGNYPYNRAVAYAVPGKAAKGAHIPDGQCPAVPRGCTKIGHTSTWRRGINVLDAATTPGQNLPIGTTIARFSRRADGTYYYAGEHTALFAGYRSAAAGGGISVWHMNVEGQFLTWRSFPLSVTTRSFANPREYYAVTA